jgi:PPOX class probable F420-dependent enzyme
VPRLAVGTQRPNRDSEETMTELPEAVRILFEGPNYAHLATVLPNGAPHSVPLWVDLEGSRIAFIADPESRKARNVNRDPRVAISITDRARPNVMAQVRGRVVERLDGRAATAIINRISSKYTGRPFPQRTDWVVFIVEPESVWAQTF